MTDTGKNHHWAECPMCGPMVVCGECGNNCCNGGYGKLADGSDCPRCPSVYDLQSRPSDSGSAWDIVGVRLA